MQKLLLRLEVPAAWWDACLIGAMASIWFLSSQPHWPVPNLFDLQDKLMHALAYALLATIAYGWRLHRWPELTNSAGAWLAWAIAALYGAVDEWHQSFVPGRCADLWDFAADALGAAWAVAWLSKGPRP